jgi:hypothetical protein
VSNFWRCLEDLAGLVAVPAVWRARLDGEFDGVRRAFLSAVGAWWVGGFDSLPSRVRLFA